MLMSAAPSTSVDSSGSGLPSPTAETLDEDSNRLVVYLRQLAGNYEMELDVIVKDHCYARPWNWKPENIYVKPTKKLFFSKNTTPSNKYRKDEDINVEDIGGESSTLPLDLIKIRGSMDELQRLAILTRSEEDEDWEEKIDKTLWSPIQNRIFSKVTRILSSERLARLVKAKNETEPIFRRMSVDIAAKRFRETLASTGWDWRLVHWLHNLLFEHLSQEYLAIYLDILQTLRVKIPQLIDKIIALPPISNRIGPVTWETFGTVLKRSWDPIASSLNVNRLKKLPGNPILIVVPSGVTSTFSSRQHKWVTQLGSLGMVVTVHTHLGLAANRMTMLVCMDQLVQVTRAKIQDIRSDSPGRPIILVGFNTGAALACQVAQMEHVTAVICIGFPFSTVEGKRGTPDDTLIDIRCPVMFIIGQNATLVRSDDLEDLREKLLVETSLVVVGTADDHLRISTSKKILEGITQSMVDRCILDEIGDFVGSILLQPHPLPLRSTSATNCDGKNKKEPQKRRNSTSSSMESEPNSPVVRKLQPTISSTMSIGTNVASSTTSKAGTFGTQSNLVQISGQHVGYSSTLKRKRTASSQKNQHTEHLKMPRHSGQTNINSENGITLNIGTLASLAPIGPIRLAPTPVGQSASTPNKTLNTSKSSNSSVKIPKTAISTNVSLQGVSKIKTIVPSNKTLSNVIPHNYKQVNVSDKSGDAKLMNVFSASGNQIRVNTLSGGTLKPVASSGTLSNLLQSGKSSTASANAASSTRVSSASSILLTTTNSPMNSITPSTSSASKAMEEMGMNCDSHHAMLDTTHSLDVSKSAHTSQGITSSNTNNSHNMSCGNMVENSLHNKSAPSSVIVPLNNQSSANVLPLPPNKLKISHKSVKTMPRITVNANNLQKLQQKVKPQSIQKSLVSDINGDLGNILDIPIIFAKDDDNLNNLDRMPVVTQAMLVKETHERPKLNSTTKVVLISNKQDKLQQTQQKFGSATTQAVICPANMPVQNLNHFILQTRAQSGNVSANNRVGAPVENRSVQPTVKYTKIILAKRNSQPSQQQKRTEQMIVTKTSEDMNAPKILTLEKDEHRYLQMSSKASANYKDPFADSVLEIEDAIKTNIIERKYVSTPAFDATLPVTLDDDDCDILDKIKLDDKKQSSEQFTFDNVGETQS